MCSGSDHGPIDGPAFSWADNKACPMTYHAVPIHIPEQKVNIADNPFVE